MLSSNSNVSKPTCKHVAKKNVKARMLSNGSEVTVPAMSEASTEALGVDPCVSGGCGTQYPSHRVNLPLCCL